MNEIYTDNTETDTSALPNGAAAAAIVAAGFGCFSLGACAFLGDAIPALKPFFTFYTPTGPLSGVTTIGIVAWLLLWALLARTWGGKNIAMGKSNLVAFLLLGGGFLLTFPPFVDFLQGK
jgi:hypothetical protein